jgi:hypothetical protein
MNHHRTRTGPPHRLAAVIASSRVEPVLLAVTAAALTAGGIAWLAGGTGLADLFWALGTLSAVVPAARWVVAALRQGRAGVDLIAVLALGGTLAVHKYLAGALIALMLATDALRALRVDQAVRPPLTPAAETLIHRFAAEHDDLQDVLESVRDSADRPPPSAGRRPPPP